MSRGVKRSSGSKVYTKRKVKVIGGPKVKGKNPKKRSKR